MMSSRCVWVKLLLFMFVFVLSENYWSEGCGEEERLALFQLKHFFNDPYSLKNWKEGDENSDCCLWEGVECSNTTGRVKELNLIDTRNWELGEWYLNASLFSPFQELELLDLSYNNIAGFVENEGLSSLTSLKFLYLAYNMFNNSISSSLDGLSSVTTLSLRYNRLEGSIDMKALSSLTNLKFLYLEGNMFNNSILSSLDGLSSLTTLSLYDNRLEGSIDMKGFGRLTSLKELDLSYNQLREINNLNGLSKFESLDLSGNTLNRTIFSSLSDLSSLKALHLFEIGLEGTFDIQELDSLSNLEELDMSYNAIDKFVIPKDYRGLKKLNSFGLNGLVNISDGSTLIHSLGSFPSLKKLELMDNNFIRSVLNSTGLCELVHLQELDISNNDLRGILPWCLANMTSLRVLDVSFNQFTEDISSSPLVHLTSIQSLLLSYNYFQIPISLRPFYNHSNLTIFNGDNNQVLAETDESQYSMAPKFQLISLTLCGYGDGGTIPNFLYHQHDLNYVDLSCNNLTGDFPNWLLENNTKLEALVLANNSLSGPFNMPSNPHRELKTLDISNNLIRGHIPIQIGEFLPSLTSLNISINNVYGSIPSSFGNMSSLKILDLSNNQLTGGVPEHLAMGCFSLGFLVLSNNNLQGHIFSKGCNLRNLVTLQLDDNRFIGEIPECLANISSLKGLYLSDNYLFGRIPRWLGNLSSLEDIMMSNNHLEGPIPTEFCQLDYLEILDLSENNISGSLLSCLSPSSIKQVHLSKNMLQGQIKDGTFCNSSSLVTLDLSYNLLFGSIPNWIDRISQLRYLILANNNLEGEVPVELCRLNQLKLIDLSHNNLSGQIPHCLNNTALHKGYDDAAAPTSNSTNHFFSYYGFHFINYFGFMMRKEENITFTTKEISYPYNGRPLAYMFGIDLSCNKLIGDIPLEVGYLTRIRVLNLSHNYLTGSIPTTFSNLNQIESLDLSYNKLNGKIPPQLVKLNALAVFRVSHNNLSGKIPEWTAQFATFNESSYEENPLLCGQPLPNSCNEIESPPSTPKASIVNQEDNNLIDMDNFYTTFIVSYVTAFLGFIIVLYVNPYWRGRLFLLGRG